VGTPCPQPPRVFGASAVASALRRFRFRFRRLATVCYFLSPVRCLPMPCDARDRLDVTRQAAGHLDSRVLLAPSSFADPRELRVWPGRQGSMLAALRRWPRQCRVARFSLRWCKQRCKQNPPRSYLAIGFAVGSGCLKIRDREVGGSNPLAPIHCEQKSGQRLLLKLLSGFEVSRTPTRPCD
jgi:hypothetical protein